MIVTFAWWFAFAVSIACIAGGAILCSSYTTHKSRLAVVCGVLAICLGVGAFGVTAGHGIAACNEAATRNNHTNGACG